MRIFKKLLLPLVLLLSVSLTSCGISDFLFPSSETSETTDQSSETSETTEETTHLVNLKIDNGEEISYDNSLVLIFENPKTLEDMVLSEVLDIIFEDDVVYSEPYDGLGRLLNGITNYIEPEEGQYIRISLDGKDAETGVDYINISDTNNFLIDFWPSI